MPLPPDQIVWFTGGDQKMNVGADWLSGRNWAPGVVPPPHGIAAFRESGPSRFIGVDLHQTTNNGAHDQAVGSIRLLRGLSTSIGNSSVLASGTLTLFGDAEGVLLANATPNELTIVPVATQAGGAQAMTLAIMATGKIVIDHPTGEIILRLPITGRADLLLSGQGVLTLDADNRGWTGALEIGGRALVQLGHKDALSNTRVRFTPVSSGTLAINGFDVTLSELTAPDTSQVVVQNNCFSVGRLTVDVAAGEQQHYAGQLRNGGLAGLSFAKAGVGRLVLTGDNAYTEGTSIEAGTLELRGQGSLASSPIVVAAGATFDVASVTCGKLVLAGTQRLQGNGTVIGHVVTAEHAVVEPGEATKDGVMTFDGDLTLQTLTFYQCAIFGVTPDSAARVHVTGRLRVQTCTGLTVADAIRGPHPAGRYAWVIATSDLAIELEGDGFHVHLPGGWSDGTVTLDPRTQRTLTLHATVG